jgi:hypothetical protein
MKMKKEVIILVLAIAALGAYLVMHSKDQTHFELPEIADVESQKINRVEISKGASTIELNKKDDQWTIGPKAYLADNIKVRNMINAAAGLTITALVSESGNYDRYDLTEDKKVNVRAYAGKDTLRDFDIGRQAPTHQHTFVKLMDNPKVYHAQGAIDATFDTTADDLRDKTVLAYQKEDITTLTISKGEQSLTLTKKEVAPEKKEPAGDQDGEEKDEQPQTPEIQWMDSNATNVLKSEVDLLIGDFAKLKCDDYMEDNAKEGLNNPLWTVTLSSDKGQYMLSVFDKENDESIKFPALSSGSAYAFNVNKSRIETFEKHIDKLLKPEAGADK